MPPPGMMILPEEFNDFISYFEELVLFLQKYAWLYDTPVTSFLTSDILNNIPEDWIKHLSNLSNEELNNFPSGLIKDDWPSSLKLFCLDCKRLTLPVLTCEEPLYEPYLFDKWLQVIPREIWRGMSPKKKDEIMRLSAFVHQECKMLGIGKILDLGSGLGYIDRLLLLRGYRILGIEAQSKLVSFATIQKENFFPPNIAKNLNYHNMKISRSLIPAVRSAILNDLFHNKKAVKKSSGKQNNENVNKYDWEKLIPLCKEVLENENSEQVCMIGLHSCGDLSVTGIKMYLKLSEVTSLVLAPCCYHKMSFRSKTSQGENELTVNGELCAKGNKKSEEVFKNFPLSEVLTGASLNFGSKFICRSFLRLASQASNKGWQGWTEDDHQRHSFSVLSRAVIELFAEGEGAKFKKCFRRVVKKNLLKGLDFSDYIDQSLNRCEFVNENELLNFEEHKDKIRSGLLEKWEQHKSKLKVTEILTALQMCLEPVTESLVVADRICFLQENGVDSVRVVKVFDNQLSPRCLAYIASKDFPSL